MRWKRLLQARSIFLIAVTFLRLNFANMNQAVGDKTYIMFDSGIRGGADVFKALALGAQFVFVGRLWVWGLSIRGEIGVKHVMKSLLADFDILMNVAGFQTIDQIIGHREHLDSLPPGSGGGLIAEKSKL